jgi:hypothetical protein
VTQAYAAKTYGQLQVLVADLPAHSVAITGDALPEPDTLVLKTKAPNLKQSGQWTVPQRITAESTTGFITIDFTRASCAHREVAVEAITRNRVDPAIAPRRLGRADQPVKHQHLAHQQQGARDSGSGLADRDRGRAPALRLHQDQATPPQTSVAAAVLVRGIVRHERSPPLPANDVAVFL